jgi:hypothetical protein
MDTEVSTAHHKLSKTICNASIGDTTLSGRIKRLVEKWSERHGKRLKQICLGAVQIPLPEKSQSLGCDRVVSSPPKWCRYVRPYLALTIGHRPPSTVGGRGECMCVLCR